MLNYKSIAAITLLAATAGAAADDAGTRPAQRLLEEARNYGVSEVRGAAAGETGKTVRQRHMQRDDATTDRNERRWSDILRKQSLGN